MNPHRRGWKEERARRRARRKARRRRDKLLEGGYVVFSQPPLTIGDEAKAASEVVEKLLAERQEEREALDRELGESREKGTQEVGESSGGDGDLHGGDGNSGEVEGSVAETAALDQAVAQQVLKAADAGKIYEALRLARGLLDPSQLNVNSWHSARDSVREEVRVRSSEATSPGPSPQFAPTRAEMESFARKAKGDAVIREIRDLVRKLVDGERAHAGKRKPVPLVDGRNLVRELVGKSYRIHRARAERRHSGTYAIVAVDCSGSCSSYSEELLAAMALLTEDPDIVFVKHSNGYFDADDVWGAQGGESWIELAEGVDVVLNIGDDDALQDILYLWEAQDRKLPVVWFDNFLCSEGVARGHRGVEAALPEDHGWDLYRGIGGALGVRDALRLHLQGAR